MPRGSAAGESPRERINRGARADCAIGEKADEVMTRIETSGAVAETLDDLLSEATEIADEQGSRSGGRLVGVSGRGALFVYSWG